MRKKFFTGKGKGFKSEIVVKGKVEDKKITNVEVVSSNDTKEIGETALPKLVEEANQTKKFHVDAVSGASRTSKGFNDALKDIENQSKGVKKSTETNVNDGTYSITVTSFVENQGLPGSGKALIKVTFKDNQIKDISVPKYTDTPVIGGMAFDILKKEIIKSQSTSVDAITSATISSNAYLSGVEKAIDKAGGNPTAFANRPIVKPTPKHEELSTDIIAIGAGLAGFSAALEAAEDGAKVMLLEAGQTYSSSTSRAQGFVMGANTDEQKRRGIKDNTDDFYDDLMEVYGDEPNIEPKLLRKLANESASYIKFLEDQGLTWDKVVNISPKKPRLTKRAHTIKGMGTTLMTVLVNSAQKKGVDLRLGTKVDELIVDNGVVKGVKATTVNGDELTIRASAVIVCVGSYTANLGLIKKLNPKMTNIEVRVGNGNGSAFKFFNQVNAKIIEVPYLQFMYYFYGKSFGDKFPEAIPESPTLPNYDVLSVDGGGNRLASEDDFTFEFTKRCWYNGYDEGYAVYGQKTAEKYPIMTELGLTKRTAHNKNFGYKEESIEKLAQDVGINPSNLKKTIDRYNMLCDKGEDKDFHKNPNNMVKITAPYYVLRLPQICSDGYTGAKINEHAQVINQDDQPVTGLYAAGSCADGQVMGIDYYGDGMSLLICGVFGRSAAKDAVSKLKK
ncbi:FAD-dependent oxidoreductase [Lactobacillus panisapium]|uniref:FAD-dependent oxidoreductase n=1 Tax=Lactobacillus panisapium TaxID=2012495 RepID=UPI001C697D4E|nr:FAD-dependent oxidoreductase [Lactobacillus panisapium]QYN56763.1 FAD-dependent oxidoreductase [Lactobacillus panisapium]